MSSMTDMEAGALVQKVEEHSGDIKKLWEKVNEIVNDLRDRLPQWVTWLLMTMGTAIGAMATFIVSHCLMGGK